MKFRELVAVADTDQANALAAARELLEGGGLLVHPTSGVYGIGGRMDPELDGEVARLKGRPQGPGLIRLVAGIEVAEREFPAARWSPAARRLAEEFWPGPLTLVLEDDSEHGVAMRAESHPFTRALLVAWGRSLSSSSLNLTGGPPAADAGAAREVLVGMPPTNRSILFANAGRLAGPPPSTLVRVTGSADAFEILRPGAIPLARLADVAGDARAVASRKGET